MKRVGRNLAFLKSRFQPSSNTAMLSAEASVQRNNSKNATRSRRKNSLRSNPIFYFRKVQAAVTQVINHETVFIRRHPIKLSQKKNCVFRENSIRIILQQKIS